MDDLKRLKITRRAQRAQATKTWNKAVALMEAETNEGSLQTLQVVLQTFDTKIEQLKRIDENISTKIEDEKDLEREIEEADDYLNELMDKRYRIQFFVHSGQTAAHSHSHSNVLTPTQNHGEHSAPQGVLPQSNSSSAHRLPKLALPIFSGNPLKWQTFWDSYKAAIHNIPTLSDVQKFSYLKAQLSDEAARAIDGLPLTESNYAQSVTILEERFGQPHKITNAHMQALLDLQNPSDSVTSLRSFYDSMENHIRGLEALGKKQDTYGDLLVPIILSKLPIAVKHNLIREHGTTEWAMEQLRKAILKEIQILEAGEETTKLNHFSQSFNTFPSTASLLASTSQDKGLGGDSTDNSKSKVSPNSFKPKACIFCKGSHKPNDCTIVSDPVKRKQIAFQANLCFNCLNNHRVSQCKSKNRCRQCRQKHHTSLCQGPKEFPEQPKPGHNEQKDAKDANIQCACTSSSTVTETTSSSQETSKNSTPTSVSNLHTNLSDNKYSHQCTLLKTAVATVETRNRKATAHILFDEGAQRSFITEKLAKELDLVPDKTEILHLSVFGGPHSSIKKVDVATVHLRADTGETIPVQVVIIPVIAVPQKTHLTTAVRELPYLKGLKLAHPITSDDQFNISLLIGADHYWDVVEDKIIRGAGPTAAKSKIGYLLSGPTVTHRPTLELSATILKAIVTTERDEETMERFWNLESIGILSNETEEEERKFVKDYQDSSIHLENGRYKAKLPWKPNHPPLPTNEAIARGRTRSTVRRLASDPKKLRMYAQIIAEQQQRGFIEKLSHPERIERKCHYIPHHAVLKDSSTTPLRIVYDCSCKPNDNQPSLNSCLTTGPAILNDLTAILIRFRCYHYASTYQSAAEQLIKLMKSPHLQTQLSKRAVQWKFIPKRAPWYGGFWERLIGLTKLSLKKVLGRANVQLSELQTIVAEIEAILNDRPLTFVSSNIEDEQPLTPSHLLYGRRITALPHPLIEENEWSDPTFNEDPNLVQHLAKLRANLIHHFWNRWRKEYLTSLREFHKTSGKNEIPINVGDVVQVHDDTKRINWRLAVVENLITGNDGLVRAANIRTSTGRTNRPIAKLYPLEVTATTPTVNEPTSQPKMPNDRPVRAKATPARERIREWTSLLSRPPEDVED